MLNAYLQVGVVALVTALLLLLFTLINKKVSVNRILTVLTFAIVGGSALFMGLRSNRNTTQQTAHTNQIPVNRYFAFMYAENGEYADAKALYLQTISEEEKTEDFLVLARLTALEGDYTSARVYYKEYLSKVTSDADASKEAAYIETLLGYGFKADNAARMRLLGLQTANGAEVKADKAAVFASEEFFDVALLERLLAMKDTGTKKNNATKQAEKLSESVITVSKSLTSYMQNGSFDEESLEKAAQSLNRAIKPGSVLRENETVRNAALMANALLGNSAAVVKDLDEYSTVAELAVATELYVRGLVKDKQFVSFISQKPEKETMNEVYNKAKSVLKNRSKNLSEEDKKRFEATLELLSVGEKDYVLKNLLILFSQKAENQTKDRKSKLYLELAKGFDYADMGDKASDYIDLALSEAEMSDDAEYASSMIGLLKIISGKNDYSDVKSVPVYAKEALSRLMPVPMEIFEKNAAAKKDSKNSGSNIIKVSAANGTGRIINRADESLYTYESVTRVTFDSSKNPVLNVSDKNTDNGDEEEKKISFEERFTQIITQKKAAINIGSINADAFPEITTKFSFGKNAGIDEDNIHDKINLYDCGYPISEFTAEKIDELQGKIILLCDMSGSMSGNENDLKDAVISFTEGMNDSEKVAIIGFDSSVVFRSGFLDDPENIKSYTDRINANGGTAIYPTILEAAELFTDETNDNNIIIVMTDGQDGAKPSDSVLTSNLQKIVADHNCTIYTVGLGSSVDSNYLSKIASIGNGQYLYVNSAESLKSFYEFIHVQIANAYLIHYTAKDTFSAKRLLQVEYKEAVGSASKIYYLNGAGQNNAGDTDNPGNAGEPYDPNGTEPAFNGWEQGNGGNGEENDFSEPLVHNSDRLQIYGFDKNYIYVSDANVTLSLLGANFKATSEYTLKLQGALRDYSLKYTYISDSKLEVVVPFDIALGTYDVRLSDDNESCSKRDALTIAKADSMQYFKFGAYHFTCDSITEKNGTVTLSGNVIMNGWLHFKGNLTFSGDVRDSVSQQVTMKDSDGSYVSYSKNATNGIAKRMADLGISLPIPQLGTITLYNGTYNPSSYQDFKVQKITLNLPMKVNGLADIGGSVSLYPDMIYSEAFYTQLDFKFLNKILTNLPKNIFNNNVTGGLAITDSEFLLKASYETEYEKSNDTSKRFQLGALGLYLKKLSFQIDTISEKYSVEGAVGFEAFKGRSGKEFSGVGLKLTWNGDGFDGIKLSADIKQKLTETPIPLTISKLSIGADRLSAVKTAKDLLNSTITGGFNLGTTDILDKVPKTVKEFFDLNELYLAEMDDAKISVTLGDFNLGFETDLKVLGIKLAKAKIELGKMNYQNAILGINETQYGVDADMNIGVHPQWKNLEATLDGDVRVTIGYPFGGFTLKGDVGYDLSWFLFDFAKELYGDFGIGVYWNSNNEVQFIVKAYGQNAKGKTSGFRVDISGSDGVKKQKY